ncbi:MULTISPECIES: ATP-binding protein [unclassified Granulicatella]|uniref:ATP-binding protein n=1 Tax=unclassified Granulicatella TaxID=2630493 RepID=UPI0010745D4A|nr:MULTISPECIES: ATP-binding protein [unclassified Granulicatella]MBF0780407.1 GHKL domain-containing protein [Granulicatella sp. 19428wC4_WM01]TFU95445.1 GHKL domain-containing protein [Granulicatella sp. WM01]
MKKMTLFTKVVFLVLSVVMLALLTTTVFIGRYVETRERHVVETQISSIAHVAAHHKSIIHALEQEDSSGIVQDIAQSIMENTGVDFVVVMDTQYKRYSHPTTSIIGGTFSNIEDAEQTLTHGDHFSYKDGTLGAGVRYFTKILNAQGNVIGIVCVGYRQVTISAQIQTAFTHVFSALSIGMVIAFVLAYGFTRWLKRILLNLEPEEIAHLVMENAYVSEHITEGILAIDRQRKIIFTNRQLLALCHKAQFMDNIKNGETIPSSVYDVLFAHVMTSQEPLHDKQMALNHINIVINCNPIYLNGKMYGAVATIRDESDLHQLITELSSTEKYNDTLRAQNHHFMNQMHVLQGLIDLQHFSQAEHYIRYLKQNYHIHLGHVSDKVKVPVLAGLLLGKIQEATQKNVQIIIDDDSDVPEGQYLTLYHDLALILGVLIDNAIEAVALESEKTVNVYLYISQEEQVALCVVEDTGSGISEESRHLIFQRGYSTKGENRGYGLEAVEAIVKKYGGTIDVSHTVHGGARFSIELPLMEVEDEYIDY